MANKTLLASLVALCCWGCGEKKASYETQNLKQIVCEWDSKEHLVDYFDQVIIVPLDTIEQALFSDNATVYAHAEDYFVVDHLSSGKVYRFDSVGRYKNSIGQIGSGPKEYLVLSDFSINDQNEIEIYSRLNNAKMYYKLDGAFLRKTSIADPFTKAISVQGNDYIYAGYNNVVGKGRISKCDTAGNPLWYLLSSEPKVLMMDEVTPVFSRHADRLFVRETFNDTIYSIKDNSIEALYRFDFGKYTIPYEFWTQDNTDKSTMILLNSDFATIRRFCQNEAYSLAEIQLQKDMGAELRFGYGLQNIKQGKWRWFFFDQSTDAKVLFSESARTLTDRNEVVFLLETQKLLDVQDSSLFSNPEALAGISERSHSVLLICSLK